MTNSGLMISGGSALVLSSVGGEERAGADRTGGNSKFREQYQKTDENKKVEFNIQQCTDLVAIWLTSE